MDIKESNIAIVHDWFLKKSFGGSEKVTLIINDLLNERYSNPDIFSLTSNIDNLNSDIKKNEFVNKIINFLNSDKKRPISLPEKSKW